MVLGGLSLLPFRVWGLRGDWVVVGDFWLGGLWVLGVWVF